MTAELEYSFIDIVSDLNISYELMTRAVRVKEAVKDKLSRIFNANLVNIEKAVVEAEQEVENKEPEVEEKETEEKNEEPEDKSLEHLIDLSDENLNLLNNMLDQMSKQQNVPTTPKRAVLFTGNLFSKIREVNSKWFTLEQKPELPNVELTNQLGGEVIPGTWDDIATDLQPVVNNMNEEVPATNVDLENTINVPTIDIANVNDESPVKENATVVPEIEIPSIPEQPQVEAVANETSDIPGFMPNLFGEINNEITNTEENAIPTEEEYVPEPSEVNTESMPIDENNEVPVDEPIPEPEVESTIELPVEEKNEEPEEKHEMSIEDRIAELLNRKNEEKEFAKETKDLEEEPANEEADREMRGKTEITQSVIMARLQRVSNAMKEKDAEIKNLKEKNQKLYEDYSTIRDKMNSYDTVVRDLTSKNNDLTTENEKLSAKNENIENSMKDKIESLENQVDELTRSKKEEEETSKNAFVELKERHAREIEELKKSHAEEIRRLNEANDKKVQAIYYTISEALGETYSDNAQKTM